MDLSELLTTQVVLDDAGLDLLVDGLATGVVLLRADGATFGHLSPSDVTRQLSGDFSVAAPSRAGPGGADSEFAAPEISGAHGGSVAGDVYSASAIVARAAFGPRWRDASAGADPLAFELGRGLELDPDERHPSLSAWREGVRGALDERRDIAGAGVAPPRSRASTVVGVLVAVLVIAALVAALIPIDTDNAPPADQRPTVTSRSTDERPLEA